MASALDVLPSELLHLILLTLPLHSVLQFSLTCKQNRNFALHSLHDLDLAVLPRKIHSTLAFLNEASQAYSDSLGDDPGEIKAIGNRNPMELYQIGIATSPALYSMPTKATGGTKNDIFYQIPIHVRQARAEAFPGHGDGLRPNRLHATALTTAEELRVRQIAIQNATAVDILSSPSLGQLRNLTLHLYEVTSSELTSLLAHKFEHLQHLSLKLSHPYIHDQHLPARYWTQPPKGSPAWNALAGIGQTNLDNLRLRNLRSLRVDRAGLTAMQLRRWTEANPRLRRLELRNVRGVDLDFVRWLADHSGTPACVIRAVCLEDCEGLLMTRDEDCDWVRRLAAGSVRELSLKGCRGVRKGLYEMPPPTEQAGPGTERSTAFDRLIRFTPPKGETVRRSTDSGDAGSGGAESSLGRAVSPALSVQEGMIDPSRKGKDVVIEVDPSCL